MMENGMGIQPTYNLAERNDGFGNGGGWWIWILLIFVLFGYGGYGNGNLTNDSLLNEEFIKRDIFNTNTNVSQTGCQTQRDVLESRYTNQLGLQNLQAQQQECCCNTQRAIDNVNAQSFKNTCDITTAIHSEGEATRALINANTMQQEQSANIINTLQPTPKPAYITCSPYYAYNNGCGCNGYNNL